MSFIRFKPGATCYALLSLLFLLFSLQIKAQSNNTSLVKGLVHNNEGKPAPGVSVIIRKAGDNFTSGTSTDSSGVFSFSGIPAGGPYSFTFSGVGFETRVMAGYHIKANITLSLVVNLNSAGALALDQVVVVG